MSRKVGRPVLGALILGCLLAMSCWAGAGAAPAAPEGASNLGNYVWLDANKDGQHLGTEAEFTAGIDGVLVNLYEDKNHNGVIDAGEFVRSTTTGNNPNTPAVESGWYNFEVTADGTQYIVEIAPSNFALGGPLAGYVPTSANTYGPNPMVVFLPELIMSYEDADFGFYVDPTAVTLTRFAAEPSVTGPLALRLAGLGLGVVLLGALVIKGRGGI